MRRILETASKNVTCILEAREVWKFSQPILSRCLLVTMNNEVSYRQQKHQAILGLLGLSDKTEICLGTTPESLYDSRLSGADPYILLETMAGFKEDYQNALRAIGSGKSPWIQLAQMHLGRGCVNLKEHIPRK
jgi:hypothetical protein